MCRRAQWDPAIFHVPYFCLLTFCKQLIFQSLTHSPPPYAVEELGYRGKLSFFLQPWFAKTVYLVIQNKDRK